MDSAATSRKKVPCLTYCNRYCVSRCELSDAATNTERCADCGEPFTTDVCETMECGYQWQRVVPDLPAAASTEKTRPCPHCRALGFTDDPYCVTCGKTVDEPSAACVHEHVSVSEPGHFEKCLDCGAYLPAADVRYVTPKRPLQRIKVRVRLLASRVPKVSK